MVGRTAQTEGRSDDLGALGGRAARDLFVTLGAALDELETQRSVIDGFWFGMAKRSVQIG